MGNCFDPLKDIRQKYQIPEQARYYTQNPITSHIYEPSSGEPNNIQQHCFSLQRTNTFEASSHQNNCPGDIYTRYGSRRQQTYPNIPQYRQQTNGSMSINNKNRSDTFQFNQNSNINDNNNFNNDNEFSCSLTKDDLKNQLKLNPQNGKNSKNSKAYIDMNSNMHQLSNNSLNKKDINMKLTQSRYLD